MTSTTCRRAPDGTAALTVKETTARLGCGVSNVHRLIRDGTLDTVPSLGRATLVSKSSVERYLPRLVAWRNRKSTPPPLPAGVDWEELARAHGGRWTAEEIALIREYGITTVARGLGVSRQAVAAAFKKYG